MLRLILVFILFAPSMLSAQIASAFSYQGVLRQSGNLANGSFDFNAQLYTGAIGGVALNPDALVEDVAVVNGVFTLTLDFGLAQTGFSPRWIELRVRDGVSTGSFSTLSPRQAMLAVPYAYRADLAGGAYWGGLLDVPAGFADNIDNGSVTQVNAGAGLSGGPINDSGTLSIASGGVQNAMLADQAVNAAKVDPAQVQLRVNASCASGSVLVGISQSGAPICSAQTRAHARTVLPGNVSGNVSVAIGNDGLPVIAYVDSASNDPFVIKCAQSDCSGPGNVLSSVNPVIGVGASTGVIDLVVPASGLPMLVYFGVSSQGVVFISCATPDCSSTSAIVTLASTGSVVSGISLALTPTGSPTTSFVVNSPSRLYFVGCSNSSCSGFLPLVLHAQSPIVPATPVLLYSGGLPTVVYHDSAADDLHSVRCTNNLCNGGFTDNNLLSAGSAGSHTAAVMAGDRPTIAWRDASNGNLRAAACLTTQCAGLTTSSLVDGNSLASSLNEMVLGANGAPLIAGRSGGNQEFLVSSCGTQACSNYNESTVIDMGPVASKPGIAIAPDGTPVLAYHGSGGIVVIKCGNRSCR